MGITIKQVLPMMPFSVKQDLKHTDQQLLGDVIAFKKNPPAIIFIQQTKWLQSDAIYQKIRRIS